MRWKSECTGLPTAQTMLASNFRVTAMSHTRRRIADLDLTKVAKQRVG
jgi:hypothetical protein